MSFVLEKPRSIVDKTPRRSLAVRLVAVLLATVLVVDEAALAAPTGPTPASATFSQAAFRSAFQDQALLLPVFSNLHSFGLRAATSVRQWAGNLSGRHVVAGTVAAAGVLSVIAASRLAAPASSEAGGIGGTLIVAAGLFLGVPQQARRLLQNWHVGFEAGRKSVPRTLLYLGSWAVLAVFFYSSLAHIIFAPAAFLGALIGGFALHLYSIVTVRSAHRVDDLTGAWNRNYLEMDNMFTGQFNPEGHLPRLFKAALRGDRPLAAVMVDIDHFKAVNTNYGHEGGDKVLRAVAQTIRSVLRPGDELVRYGGEEFLVLLPGASEKGAMDVAERIRTAIASTSVVLSEQKIVSVTASFGVVGSLTDTHPSFALDRKLAAWLAAADDALYLAKGTEEEQQRGEGRNRVRLGKFRYEERERPTAFRSVKESLRTIFLEQLRQIPGAWLRFLRPAAGEPWYRALQLYGTAIGLAAVYGASFYFLIPAVWAFILTLAFQMLLYRYLLNRAVSREIFDVLTGTWKRSYAGENKPDGLLPTLLRAATDVRHSRPASVVMVDLNQFKAVNDTYGHKAGDEVLKAVAATITKSLRPSDTVVRWGGDEFLIILPNANLEQAKAAAGHVVAALHDLEISIPGNPSLKMMASFGVAEAASHTSVEAWVKAADDAAYQAKKPERGPVVVSGDGQDPPASLGGSGTTGPDDTPPPATPRTPASVLKMLQAA